MCAFTTFIQYTTENSYPFDKARQRKKWRTFWKEKNSFCAKKNYDFSHRNSQIIYKTTPRTTKWVRKFLRQRSTCESG